ncbi:MAG: hypothetical protein HFI93_00435 [Lachnospiraceae bacterium]|nr:hypothetical protein [Lachnospiraceae bacterium]
MKYTFELEAIHAKKGKLPREERYDITQYIASTVVEAPESKKAIRQLTNRVNGKLSRESDDERAVITLPDYGNCQLVVHVRETC